jgi:hypothetical protein
MKMRFHPALVMLFSVCLAASGPKTIEQLKSEAAAAHGGQQGKLYAELAHRMVDVASTQFARNEAEKGQATVLEILDYAAKAHDIALNTRSKMKEVEIHLRETQRHLENMKRTLVADDRPPIDAAEKKLVAFRQDLMDEMFAPKKKEHKQEEKKDEKK